MMRQTSSPARSSACVRSRSLARAVRPVVEFLESRRLLSVTFQHGTLNVVGTDQADVIDVSYQPERSSLIDVVVNGQVSRFQADSVRKIYISTLSGNDTVYAGGAGDPLSGIKVNIDGGDGNDLLLGSASFVTINAGTGNDTLVGVLETTSSMPAAAKTLSSPVELPRS